MKGFVLLTTLMISLSAFAGPVHIGNGGNAIKIDNKYYLLDLAEQGIAEDPGFRPVRNQFYYDYFRARTAKYANRALESTLELFSDKLSEIAELDPVYAEALVTAFENVRWMFVNYRLNDIPVDSIIAGPYYQIAARTNEVILVDLMYWSQMNEKNRVALLFHELNYILIYPKKEVGSPVREKSPLQSRLQTGYLFTQNFQKIDPIEFSKRIQYWFPSRFANKFEELMFYPFTYQETDGVGKMAFNPFIQINSQLPGPHIAAMTAEQLRYNVCDNNGYFELKTIDLMAAKVKQDIYDGDNNSQDVTTFEDSNIPGFHFVRLPNESCNTASARLYKEIGEFLPGVFYNE